ncbi:MAG: hypothetical protein AB7C98_08060 [Acidithiobacillus sp.]
MDLPLSSLIIIVFLLALVISAGLWKLLSRKRLLKEAKSSKVKTVLPPKTSLSASDTAVLTPTPALPVNTIPVEVDETSILDEVEIYLSYGHQEQAATSLSWYVAHNPNDLPQARRLLTLYLELPDIDRFSELLESLCESKRIIGTEAQSLVLAGLQATPLNLQLRVLAENLNISNAQLATLTTATMSSDQNIPSSKLSSAQKELQQALINPEPMDLDLSGFSEKPELSLTSAIPSAPVSTEHHVLLISSEAPQKIATEEYTVAASLVSPLESTRQLAAAGQTREAEQLLRRSLVFDSRKLVLHVALLDLLYKQLRCDSYAEALLQLHISLWGAGTALRNRLLRYGQQLGEHPLWSQLAASDRQKNLLAELAEEYGLYLPLTAIPLISLPLITEKIRSDYQITPSHSGDSVLEEFDSLLEYGQVEEAVELLEKAILAQPDHKTYYGPLLEMYERMRAYERFSNFIKSVLSMDIQPDEDIMRQMFTLAERLQNQPQRQVI